jgi:hypothetical protein
MAERLPHTTGTAPIMLRDAAALLFSLAAAAPAWAQPSPLPTPDQLALDSQSLRVFASPAVQAQIGAVTRAFATDPYAQTREGQATLPHAAREVVFAAVQDSIDRDPTNPRLYWVWASPHRWHGIDVPASKVLMPNVDNVFRIMPVQAGTTYRITATPTGPIPAQFSIQLLPALPAETDWSHVLQELVDTDLTRAPDGSFSLTIGPHQAGAGPNHITTTPAAHFILIRDTLQDWRTQMPYRLAVQRLDGPPEAGPATDATLATQAAALVAQITPRIQAAKGGGFANAPGFFQGPANQLSPPKIREGGRWGLSASGHFHLAPDEALVLTLDPAGAKYLAVQLASAWLGSLDYVHHTASLNLAQAKPNWDGSVTMVIAAQDPHVANWLDTTGLHDGSIFVRWQQLPPHLAPTAHFLREVRLAPLSALGVSLPHVTPQARKTERAARAAAYARRYGG